MKVVHIIVGLEKGGAEGMLVRLIDSQCSLGLPVVHTVISLSCRGFYGELLKNKYGVEVFELNLMRENIFFGFFKLIRLLSRLRPDIVQTWMAHADLFGGLASRIVGVKKVIWGIRTTDYSVEGALTRYIRKICAHLSHFIPRRIVCAAHASMLASIGVGYCERKMIVIPNGFNLWLSDSLLAESANLRKDLGVPSGVPIVGCVGRFNPAKDHANFVKAAGYIASKFTDCYFLMVGRDLNADNSQLVEQIGDTGFADRFLLLGERTDVSTCLQAMDVFVLPSFTEGFPNVLGEAMAIGVPCVTTNVGDAQYLLGDGGLVVPARNAEALAQAVSVLLGMTEVERKKMGLNGRKRVENEFSMAKAAKRFYKLYLELFNQKS